MTEKTKVLYLHGLGSSGKSSTAAGLEAYGLAVAAPDYRPEHYRESIAALVAAFKAEAPDIIVGTSMGGYYAMKLAELTGMSAVVINPCYDPAYFLGAYLKTPAQNYVTGEPIHFTREMLTAFEPVEPTKLRAMSASISIYIGLNDDVIPAEGAMKYFDSIGFR